MTAIRDEHVLTITPKGVAGGYRAELWRYRELFAFLAWRDILVRYKQTVIGVAWAVLRPFLTMVVFTLVFGRLAKMPSEGDAPYAIMVFAGMLPWQLFASSFRESSQSLVSNASMVSKVYFPRIVLPVSAVVVGLVDFAISCVVLAGMMAWYGFVPGWRAATLPLFVVLAALAALGPSLIVSALNVRYRDFRYVVPFIIQFGLYISPVGFSAKVIPEQWRLLYALNPMVGVIDGFRWALLGQEGALDMQGLALSSGLVVALLLLGVWYFRHTERTFADTI